MEAYALTDTGRVRYMNQDYIYSSPENVGSLPNLFLVADGMGGHKAGDYASRYTVENLVVYLNRQGQGSPVMQLKTGIQAVNERLYEESRSREELRGMGCTLVAAVAEADTLYVANVGDSRLYLIRQNSIRQITRDHSYVEEMAAMGRMDRDSAYYKSHKNIITRAMGIERSVEADFFEAELCQGDYFLLCSDGLTNMVDDESIRRIVVGSGSLKDKASQLIAAANHQGGADNIAVVLVRPGEGGEALC